MATTNPAPPRYHVRRVVQSHYGAEYEVRPYNPYSEMATTNYQLVHVMADGTSRCTCRRFERTGHCPHIAAVLARPRLSAAALSGKSE